DLSFRTKRGICFSPEAPVQMREDQVLNRPVYQQGSSAVRSPRLPARAGQGRAQIRATVTAKSPRGQGIKHHILYDLTADTIILHTQCSMRLKYGWGRVRKGESRERNYSSSLGKTTQSSFDKMRPYSHFRRSSTVNSTALRIERNRPGPSTSPACTGTVVTLPSTCLKNT